MILIVILILIAVLVLGFLLYYQVWFLRDPEREIPKGNNIVSPADGEVVAIKEYKDNKLDVRKGLFGIVRTFTKDVAKEGYMISIFMSMYDVHVNRAPIAGIVKSVIPSKGKFFHARSTCSTYENENVQILIQKGNLKVKIIQIAGKFARRIVPFVTENQKIEKGQRVGMIKFGSQVTMILPKNIILQIKEGEQVFAGKSIIAKIK